MVGAIGYLRSRRRLWSAAGLWTGLLLLGFNAYLAAAVYVPQYRVRNDFRVSYGIARWTLGHGFAGIYDLAVQRASVAALGAGFNWQPFPNPPPLAWAVSLLAPLPFEAALVAWSVVLFAALVGTWALTAPGAGLGRAAHLALWLTCFPVAFGLMVGQPDALVVIAVAGAVVLERRLPVVAGLLLSVMWIKPQLAVLVPVCLLFAGRSRVVVGWAAASIVIAIVAFAQLGATGVRSYLDLLDLASQWVPTERYTLAGICPPAAVWALRAVVVLLCAVIAFRRRRSAAGAVVATGIVGSLLITPHIGVQDFALLILAAWLVLREGASVWQVGIFAAGYAILELIVAEPSWPVVLLEGVLLLSLAVWPERLPEGRLGVDALQPLPARG